MTFKILNQPIRKIGVLGSGQIGPDIALYFAKIFCRHSVPVVVVDISTEALSRGQKKLERKVDRGIETGAFSPAMGQAMKECCTFTSDYDALRGVDLVVEAATEDCQLKGKIFAQLQELCPPHVVLASNSSHLEPEQIFAGLADRSRTLVIQSVPGPGLLGIQFQGPAERMNGLAGLARLGVNLAKNEPCMSILGCRLDGFLESRKRFPIVPGGALGLGEVGEKCRVPGGGF